MELASTYSVDAAVARDEPNLGAAKLLCKVTATTFQIIQGTEKQMLWENQILSIDQVVGKKFLLESNN